MQFGDSYRGWQTEQRGPTQLPWAERVGLLKQSQAPVNWLHVPWPLHTTPGVAESRRQLRLQKGGFQKPGLQVQTPDPVLPSLQLDVD